MGSGLGGSKTRRTRRGDGFCGARKSVSCSRPLFRRRGGASEQYAPTNPTRPLTGASNYVFNMMLGFDSFSGKHSTSLIYNVFGERLYVAGHLGAPDGYEQPFHSLDLTYSWFPTETITVKAKLKNILDQSIEIRRESIITFEESPGSGFALSLKWEY